MPKISIFIFIIFFNSETSFSLTFSFSANGTNMHFQNLNDTASYHMLSIFLFTPCCVVPLGPPDLTLASTLQGPLSIQAHCWISPRLAHLLIISLFLSLRYNQLFFPVSLAIHEYDKSKYPDCIPLFKIFNVCHHCSLNQLSVLGLAFRPPFTSNLAL